LSAEAKLVAQREQDAKAEQDQTLQSGREAIGTAIKDQACTDCHKFRDAGDLGSAPDLTGYGSYEWLRAFIADPKHERFYREDGNDRMPSFAKNADDPLQNLLSNHDLDMLVRWLRGDDRDLTRKLDSATSAKTASSEPPPPTEDKKTEAEKPKAEETKAEETKAEETKGEESTEESGQKDKTSQN
jgi:ubiquinol-cytochrome c reductase cytochrome b subunit